MCSILSAAMPFIYRKMVFWRCSFEIWGTKKPLLLSEWTAYLSQSPLFLIRSRGRCGCCRAGHQVAKWWMCFGGVYRPNSETQWWWPMDSRERGKSALQWPCFNWWVTWIAEEMSLPQYNPSSTRTLYISAGMFKISEVHHLLNTLGLPLNSPLN